MPVHLPRPLYPRRRVQSQFPCRERVVGRGLCVAHPTRRLSCLGENAEDAQALVTQLMDADVAVVLHAVGAAQQLPSADREVRAQIAGARATAAAGKGWWRSTTRPRSRSQKRFAWRSSLMMTAPGRSPGPT